MRFIAIGLGVCLGVACAAHAQGAAWTFAVSGDSRNCGDIVMPSIAAQVKADGAAFYWHLGDFRVTTNFDEDMMAAAHGKMSIATYTRTAWPDFLGQQIAAFGDLPVFLGIGNHELAAGRTRDQYLTQFADWIDAPEIRAQRLHDDPRDHALKTYYHWHHAKVDFITLDNASADMFDEAQVAWVERVLAADAADSNIRTIVLGMHEALPDSLSAGHSMNEYPTERESGRRVYADLLAWKKRTGKDVQVIASHSHFVLSNLYETRCRKPEDVLPGWIVGSAGAVRYNLPVDHAAAKFAKTGVYGYLLGSVDAAGHVSFTFKEILPRDVTPEVRARYGSETVGRCFTGNRQDETPGGAVCDAR